MNISEDDIKKAALAFLKTHYRYRPRNGDVQWKLDMQTPDGIIADGVFSFTDDQDQPFLATFEATSFLTRDEVKYHFLYRQMIWDGLAIGSIWTALVVAYGLGTQAFDIAQWGIWGGIFRIIGFISAILAAYVFMNRFRHRYRYIYAVEQFKRYHADEQWVAIGSDVFPNADDKFLRELREQCIINGFGLVSIQPDFDAQLLITPARITTFGETRRAVDFITETQWMQRLRQSRWARGWNKLQSGLPKVRQQLPQIGEKIQDGYQKVVPKLTEKLPTVPALTGRGVLLNRKEFVDNLQRYRRGYLAQIALTLLGLGVIGGMYYHELLEAELIVLDKRRYLEEEELKSMRVNSRPEPTDYKIDTPYVAPYGDGGLTYLDEHKMSDPMLENERFDTEEIEASVPPQTVEDRADDLNNSTTQIISRDSAVPNVETPVVMRPRPPNTSDIQAETGVGIYVPDAPNQLVTYDCARFFNFTGVQYFIQEGVYPTRAAALDRIADFAENDLQANYLWLGCFGENSTQYAVFVDELTENLIDAQAAARRYRELILNAMEEEREMSVQMIQLGD
ncbi:MAG: hypothetical protein AB8G22_22475 [Saprospiraceae bacterium]